MHGDIERTGVSEGLSSGPVCRNPEPDLTPQELIARAVALRPQLRAGQAEADARGFYSEALHGAFLDAGFYRAVAPRMFGGHAFDIPTFYKAMLEISRGHPAAGWCLTLCASHTWVLAAHWPEVAQRELFGSDGLFIAPHRPQPLGRATPVDGGYVLDGVWDYCSGIPHSTHFMGGARVAGDAEPPELITFVVPKATVTVLDDWGGDRTLGMQASGSFSVKLENVFVPRHHAVAGTPMMDPAGAAQGTPGTRLHKSPMFLGQVMGPYHMSLTAPVVGAAWAALDEFEEILRTRKTVMPPIMPRFQHSDFQRAFGEATALADAAEGILMSAGRLYMDYCRRWADHGTPYSVAENIRLWGMVQQAGRLACEAIEVVFTAAGSSAARRGQRIQQYYRDAAMYRGHVAAQRQTFATYIGRAQFGLPMGLWGRL